MVLTYFYIVQLGVSVTRMQKRECTLRCIQLTYLQWIGNAHTLKNFHMLKDLHYIAHNIKWETLKRDALPEFLCIITYRRNGYDTKTGNSIQPYA